MKVSLLSKTVTPVLPLLASLYLFLCLTTTAEAFTREFPVFDSYSNATIVTDPSKATYFYATLAGFPHNYEFTLTEETDIFLEVLVPDVATAENNRNLIIVKKNVRAPVDEVARLQADAASWETFYEFWGGDRYRRGANMLQPLPPGEYLVEISTVENQGRYVFSVGTKHSPSLHGWFTDMQSVYHVKRFFGKSVLGLLQSPYYLALLIIILVIFWLVFLRKNRQV